MYSYHKAYNQSTTHSKYLIVTMKYSYVNKILLTLYKTIQHLKNPIKEGFVWK